MTTPGHPPPFPIDFARVLMSSLPEGIAGPSAERLGLLELHARLVLQWNRTMKLTSITDPREIVRRHYAEPLIARPLLTREASLLDLGTGGGYPGIPLHIAKGGGALLLVERSERKAEFLRIAVDRLRLAEASVIQRHVRGPADIDDLKPVDAVTFRAVPSPEERIALLPHLLVDGGRALLFLGAEGADRAEREATACGLLVERRIPLPGTDRSFVVTLKKPDTSVR